MYLVIVDLLAQKDTKEILKQLNRCYPFPENEIEHKVQELLGPINKRIVLQAIEAIEMGDIQRLGQLMVEAQTLFDRYAVPACPNELEAPILHWILNNERIKPHILGGKGVGSQGDGSAQFLTRSREDQQALIEIVEGDYKMPCLGLIIHADQRMSI